VLLLAIEPATIGSEIFLLVIKRTIFHYEVEVIHNSVKPVNSNPANKDKQQNKDISMVPNCCSQCKLHPEMKTPLN
jgi:hypothetical protein